MSILISHIYRKIKTVFIISIVITLAGLIFFKDNQNVPHNLLKTIITKVNAHAHALFTSDETPVETDVTSSKQTDDIDHMIHVTPLHQAINTPSLKLNVGKTETTQPATPTPGHVNKETKPRPPPVCFTSPFMDCSNAPNNSIIYTNYTQKYGEFVKTKNHIDLNKLPPGLTAYR